jgi:hypothetical protein
MSSKLKELVIKAPGFKGLNTQESGNELDPGWALTADNLVFDDAGRLAARKGFSNQVVTVGGSSQVHLVDTKQVRTLFEYHKDSSNSYLIAHCDTKLFVSNTNAYTIWTDKTGTITTADTDSWQFANFNGKVVGVCSGRDPIYWDGGAGNFTVISWSGRDLATKDPVAVLSAFGRLWFIESDRTIISYTDLLTYNTVNATTGFLSTEGFSLSNGAGGWTRGKSFATALAVWQNKLIIFGEDEILIFQGCDDPNNDLSLADAVVGIGCVARDSVVAVGNDLLFVDKSGVRGLARSVLRETFPEQDITKNVRNDFIAGVTDDRANGYKNIKCVYHPIEAFYIAKLPSAIWCIDLKQVSTGQTNEAGTDYRVTKFSGWTVGGFCASKDNELYIGLDDGRVGKYSTYLDGTATYTVDYRSSWQNFDTTVLKFPKKYSAVVLTAGGQALTLGLAYNFLSATNSHATITRSVGTGAEWGATGTEWGEDEWGVDTIDFDTVSVIPSRSGEYLQLRLSCSINNKEFGIQSLRLFVKVGRYNR